MRETIDENEANRYVMRRCLAAGRTWGKWALTCHVRWRQWTWRWLIKRAEIGKRALDVAVSLLALVLCGPLCLLIALAVKLEDGGPVIFKQRRVGKFGREFTMYKFRSMCLDAEQRFELVKQANEHKEGVTFKIKDDPRLTHVGRWLRKFSLDELPQALNVLRGEMTLVGPRPPLPSEVALYSLGDRRRLAALPGITCLWQISGRSNIDFSGQVKLDVRYLETQSLAEDLRILARTVPAVLSGKGAY